MCVSAYASSDAPHIAVRSLFGAPLPRGGDVSVTVREVAPLQFTVMLDYALPTAVLDAASGMTLGGAGSPLVLFGLARLALSYACSAPDAALVVTLSSDATVCIEVPVRVPLGATGLWVPLPCEAQWSSLTVPRWARSRRSLTLRDWHSPSLMI